MNNFPNVIPVLKVLGQSPIYKKRNITILPRQRLLVLKQCQCNSTINQMELTEFGDHPMVPDYPRIFVAPSAQAPCP